ncbi:GPI transamidase component PIG-T [Vitis vinifera]|uniref:GPI transamidase component PIG-T n=1 Tax=Vitis vinifera TaxID=29760 RepID=A0A438F4U1_VITVI|nr:GPI transamidase component PIG-T [Vitis vinifera]
MADVLRFLIAVLLFSSIATASLSQQEEEEEFSEELLLKPLADRKVLAHFHFESKAPPTRTYGHHHRLFPKALYQLVQKFQIREMELSFTQGRWNYERWGGFDPISSQQCKAAWGLFCASINFLESSTAYSAPDWGFQPFSGSLRYGSLPREAVCTENLTPWLKLLPCRDKAGLAALMDRPSIYRGFYHSQRLRLSSTEFGSTEVESGIALDQTLTVVLQPTTSQRASMTYSSDSVLQPSWSLSSIFGRKVSGRCVLAKSSNVYVQVERGLVSELKNLHAEDEGSGAGNVTFEKTWNNPVFELSIAPNRVIKEVNILHDETSIALYEYLIDNYSNSEPFDLGFTWKFPVVWSSPQAPLHAIVCCGLMFSKLCPGMLEVYFHTLQVFVDGKPQSVTDFIERMRISPSEDKVSPGVMEMALKLPCCVKSVTLTLQFDKDCCLLLKGEAYLVLQIERVDAVKPECNTVTCAAWPVLKTSWEGQSCQ